MKFTALLGMMVLLAQGMPATAANETNAPSPSTQVTLLGASQFDLASKISGRTYRIFVYKPIVPAPASGFPVMYVTDGNGLFPLAAAQTTLMALAGKSAIIVGIGYPTEDFMKPMTLRYRDLTPVTEDQSLFAVQPPLSEADQGGKSELFYRFLTEELRPALLKSYAINPKQQTLYGHSLGGLFVLEVMFNHPESFNSYVASSPSIWWDKRSVLKAETGFVSKVKASKMSLRALICVGAKEEDLVTAAPPNQPMTLSEINRRLSEARMVSNARDLSNRLMKIDARPDFVVRFQDFGGEDHVSVIAASISRALQFAVEP